MRIFAPIIIILLLMGTFLTITDPDGVASEFPHEPHSWEYPSTLHDPIWIDNETDFRDTAKDESWTGNGSAGNPFIISNYTIDANGHNCGIYIGNSSLHFIVKNCRIFGSEGLFGFFTQKSGVHMYKSSNGTLQNCEFEDNRYGVCVKKSYNVKLINNTHYMDHWGGIYLEYSYDVEIRGCTINNTWSDEIILFRSKNCHVHNNTVGESRSQREGGSDRGINMFNSDDVLVENNTCSIREGVGITVEEGVNDRILNNICSVIMEESYGWCGITLAFKSRSCIVQGNKVWNYQSGIGVSVTSLNIIIRENKVWDMKYRGIYIDGSTSCSVIGNDIDDVEHNGILIRSTTDTVVKDNHVSNCGYDGIYLDKDLRGPISEGTMIIGNYIETSAGYGIRIFNATNSTITQNRFIHNQMSSNTYNPNAVQAFDNGANNAWFSDETGNYWYDWSEPDDDLDGVVDKPYDIDGSAGSSDDFPLVWDYIPLEKTEPSEPLNLTVKVGRTFSYLHWMDPENDGNSPILGFKIYRNDSQGDPELISINEAVSHKYNDSDVTGGIEYTYWVSAFNLIGEGNLSDPVNSTPVIPFGELSISIDAPGNDILWTEKEMTVKWSCQLGDRLLKSVELQIDGESWIDPDFDDHHTFRNISEGGHIIAARVVAHDLEESTASLEFHSDLLPPEVSITSPVNEAVLMDNYTTLIYSTIDLSTSVASVSYRLDSDDPVMVTGVNTVDLNDLEDGVHRIVVLAEDEAGHTGNSTIEFKVDTTPPMILDYGPEGIQTSIPDRIFIRFSEEIDNSSLLFEIFPTMDWIVGWESDHLLVFTPNENLLLDETYEVNIMGYDLVGHPFQDLSFEFRIELPVEYGTITGWVVDELGNPMEGVDILSGEVIEQTDGKGDFTLTMIPGDHTLKISLEGYNIQEIKVTALPGELTEIGAIILEPVNQTDPGIADDDDEDQTGDDDDQSDDDDDADVIDSNTDDDDGSYQMLFIKTVLAVSLIILLIIASGFLLMRLRNKNPEPEE